MYTCIRSFWTVYDNYIVRGTKISWLRYQFMSAKSRKNFVLTEFYDTPEDEYRRSRGMQPGDYDEDTPAMTVVSLQDFLDSVSVEDIGRPFGGGCSGGAGATSDWDPHPHEDFNGAADDNFQQPDIPLGIISTGDSAGWGTSSTLDPDRQFQQEDSVQIPDPEVYMAPVVESSYSSPEPTPDYSPSNDSSYDNSSSSSDYSSSSDSGSSDSSF